MRYVTKQILVESIISLKTEREAKLDLPSHGDNSKSMGPFTTTLIDNSLGTPTPLGVMATDTAFSLVREFECLPNWSLNW